MKKLHLLLLSGAIVLGGAVVGLGCDSGLENNWVGDGGPAPTCKSGTDQDNDGYGEGCPAGSDCDDSDPTTHQNAPEICDGKDNNCDGKVDEDCQVPCTGSTCTSSGNGNDPFPVDPAQDPNVQDATGVKLDPNGDLVLDNSTVNFNYIWISNTDDLTRGTISKVDTVAMKEAARYYTTICSSKSGSTGCADVNGKPITLNQANKPSRTAVDFNFDVWVANRCLGGCQQSATKVANDPADCIDRNGNGDIDTSKDQDGDGKINVDCDGNGKPDDLSTKCTGSLQGKPPEFLGYDDECIIFTVNYGEPGDVGRSICLDTGKNNVGASNAWVGTFFRPERGRGVNQFFGINGNTGKIEATVDLVAGHHTYGCMADANHIIWSTDIGTSDGKTSWNGSLTYFKTQDPYLSGKLLRGPNPANFWKDASGQYHHYGISINADQHVWLGGWSSSWVLRFKPDRSSFDTLSNGAWTRVDIPNKWYSRGIAADSRGKVWVAIHQGHILRLEQSLGDGQHDMTGMKDHWPTTAQTVIGVGVDFDGNIWGVGNANDMASKLDVDQNGNVIAPATGTTKKVVIGTKPYTYSDFTGYGLRNFVRPQGRYVYQHKACAEGQKATWNGVSWNATTPAGTMVILRVRSGDSDATFGSWSQEFAASPATFGPKSSNPISPNPSTYLQVEFTLKNQNKEGSPILHDYTVSFTCAGPVT